MSKNTKKPGADIPSDPRNKNLNAQVSLANKGKARRMPPPATLLTAPKKESTSETPQTPNKHWGSTGTPSTPEKPDWAQLSASLPPSSRNAVSNAEFPSLSGGKENAKNIPPQRDTAHPPSSSSDRFPRKPQEGAPSQQRSYNPSFDGSKYHQQRSEGQSEHRFGGVQRPSNYFNQRSNQTNTRNNPYSSNRQGQPDRNRSGYNRQLPSYDRDKSVPEMFADSEASTGPHVHSLPIRHANFDNDLDAKGWAGKQDNVDYSEKIKFDSSGDEADTERVPLKRIAHPRQATLKAPNKSQTDPSLHMERPGIHKFPEHRTSSPESQHLSGASMQSPVRPGKPTQIMKRPTSESADQTPIEAPLPEKPGEYKTHSPHEEPFQQPQKMSMRQTVPTIPSQSTRVSEPRNHPENTSDSVPATTAREGAWNKEKQLPPPKAPSKPPTKGTETQPPTNVWERRKQNEPSEPQRQGLQEFPKLGDNDPVQSCVIVPTKIAEKQVASRGGPRTHDDDVFTQDKGSYQSRQSSWDPRRDRERRRSDEKRTYGRQGSRNDRYGNESDKSQNWRTEGGETEDRSRFGDREEEKEDRFRKNERSNTGERDRRSSSRGYQRRDYPDRDWEDRGTSGGNRGRFQGRQDDRGGDWRGDKSSFRDNERRTFQDNDRGQIRDSDRRQFRDHDKRQFRDQDRRQYHEDDRGQYRNSERGRYNGGRFRDEDRGDKYVRKSSSEGRTSSQWVRSGPPPSNVSYANAVSNRGDTEEDEVTAGQEDATPDPPRPAEGDRMQSDSQDSWRQPRPGHMKYTQQRKFQTTRAEVSESETRASPPQHSDTPARDSMTEWTDVNVDPRREEGETASSISPSEVGFIEIRKNRNKGRGMSYADTDGPRSLGRGRGRIQDDNNGIPGSRSMGPPGKTSSTADPRFSRGVSPQKSQGIGRARLPERTNQVSPKRSTQRSTDYDKKPGQLPRADSPPPTPLNSQKLSSSNSSAISNYVQPGLSFSAIASKNIERTPLPPPPLTPTKATTQPAEEKDAEKPTTTNDETASNKESDTARGKHSISKMSSADSLSPGESIELAEERSDKGDHLSDENDEIQEVVSTTIVNSYMKEEVDEIDKTPHAHLIAHSEHKEETEGVLDPGNPEEPEWSPLVLARTPTPQKQIEKSTETASTRQIPVPSKLEERPRSNTPIQASQPVPTPISLVEHKKPDIHMPTTSNVFPDASPQAMLQQSGFNSEWFNTTTMPSLGDIPTHLPFQYPIQHAMTDDDKVTRSTKQSDLADYVNAPEFMPSSTANLSQYPDTLYPASLASANFVNPNYPPDFSQQTLIQSLQPSLDAATTAGGLLTAPRINPGSYPNSQFSISSLYPSNQMMPGSITASQMRPSPHQSMLRQFTPHPMHTSQSLNAFTGYNLTQGNMRAAVMNPDKNRRNDKMGPMVDKVPNTHAMYYNNYPRKWDANTQYNGAMRKNTPTPFTPLVPQNIRNYNPNHRGNYRLPKKNNPTNTSSYMKSYAQPQMPMPPSLRNPQYQGNQSFISLVGPVRPPQQHVNQLRNPNNQFRGKNMQMNYYPPRQQMQYPGASLYILPQNNRGPQAGPQITSGIAPSIESSMAPQILSYQVQTEGDMSKSNLVGPQFNMQIQDQIPSSQKFRPFPPDNSGEDSVASEYSKIGPVAVNGRANNDLSDKMHSENSMFVPQVPNLLSSDPLQQGAPSDLIIKSHVDVSSAAPQSAMDIYGPEPLVTSSTLASSSSETLAQGQSYQSEEKLSLPPTDSQLDDQTQPQVNLDS